MAVSPPPSRKAVATSEPPARRKLDEKKIEAIINRGSTTVAASTVESTPLKNFNIKLPAVTLEQVDEVRAKRPRRPTSPKLGISTQDWLLEAIEEKLEREQKKYGLSTK